MGNYNYIVKVYVPINWKVQSIVSRQAKQGNIRNLRILMRPSGGRIRKEGRIDQSGFRGLTMPDWYASRRHSHGSPHA